MSNDVSEIEYKIPVDSYRAFFKGWGTAEILFVVFVGLLICVAVIIIVNRFILFRGKHDVKDTV